MKYQIDKKELIDAVTKFELSQNCTELLSKADDCENIYIYKTSRGRKKLVFISQHPFLYNQLENCLSVITGIVDGDNYISDRIDVFTTTIVSPSTQRQIDELLIREDLNAKIFDVDFFEQDDILSSIFHNEEKNKQDEEITHVLYDYLATGNDSAFIKKSLKYTIILFEIYQHPGILMQELTKVLKEKCPDIDSTITQDISYLRIKGKLRPKREMSRINALELTPDEQYKIEGSIKEHQDCENTFLTKFEMIIEKYGLEDVKQWLDELRKLYKQYYVWNFDDKTSSYCDTSGRSKKALDAFTLNLKEVLNDDETVQNCVDEFRTLCSSSPYLSRLALSESFLSLYKNNKYDEYINDRKNRVILDTPVFVYFMILKSTVEQIPDEELSDERYDVVKSLIALRDHSDNTEFYIPFDYVGEAYGEFQKALRLSVFDKISGFPIKVQSANTFFNHYLLVKEQRQKMGEDISKFHFEDYATEFGFPCVRLDDMNLQYKTIDYIRTFADSLGCSCIPMIKERYESFDEVKKEYEQNLRTKTEPAVRADVRQAFYITMEAQKPENMNADYYLTTWDGTLSDLRDKVKDVVSVKRSFSVRRPNILLNTISLKSFKIKSESISKDIFTYADSSFSLSERIQSIFDNILVPYFSGLMNKNADLPNAIMKMQQELLEGGGEHDNITVNNRLPLEDIFLKIDKSLMSNSCSQQDLRNFLSDSKNNEMLFKLFATAFDSYKIGKPIDISPVICKAIKMSIATEDDEVQSDNLL